MDESKEREAFERATAHIGLNYERAGLARKEDGCTYWQAETEAAWCAWRAVRAALAQPEGWVLVPKEPTRKMLNAAEKAGFHSYTGTWSIDPADCWSAMLAAAPKAALARPEPEPPIEPAQPEPAKVEAVTFLAGKPIGWVAVCPHCQRSVHFAQEAQPEPERQTTPNSIFGTERPKIEVRAWPEQPEPEPEPDTDYGVIYPPQVVRVRRHSTEPEPELPMDEMVKAYLDANDAYWRATDEIPTPPDKWRTGTVIEATTAGLRAVFAILADRKRRNQP